MRAATMESDSFPMSDASPLDAFQWRHPNLYGKLLETNQAMEDATVRWLLVYLLVVLPGGYATLWFDAHRMLFGPQIGPAGFGSFAILTVATIFVMVMHIGLVRRGRYYRHRDELLELVKKSGLGRYQLLAILQADRVVADVATALKRDRWDPVR